MEITGTESSLKYCSLFLSANCCAWRTANLVGHILYRVLLSHVARCEYGLRLVGIIDVVFSKGTKCKHEMDCPFAGACESASCIKHGDGLLDILHETTRLFLRGDHRIDFVNG